MYIRNSLKFNKEIKIIHPGEYYVSSEDELIGTLLGSCVAVCLYDHFKKIAGMNHFMLPGRISGADIFNDRSARYGISAINHLISSMRNLGAVKDNMSAKIFGGGQIMESKGGISIHSDNIKLALVMMEMEDIPVVQKDVGGDFTRKLLMEVKTGRVYLKKTTRKEVYDSVKKRDSEFAGRRFMHE